MHYCSRAIVDFAVVQLNGTVWVSLRDPIEVTRVDRKFDALTRPARAVVLAIYNSDGCGRQSIRTRVTIDPNLSRINRALPTVSEVHHFCRTRERAADCQRSRKKVFRH